MKYYYGTCYVNVGLPSYESRRPVLEASVYSYLCDILRDNLFNEGRFFLPVLPSLSQALEVHAVTTGYTSKMSQYECRNIKNS